MSRRREPRGSTAEFPPIKPATTCPACHQPIPGTDGQCPCAWQNPCGLPPEKTVRKLADEAKVDYYTGLLPANARVRLNVSADLMLEAVAASEEHRAYAYARIAARAARRAK